MEEEEDVDEKDGDKIIIRVDGDVSEIKLRYVKSMFFNGDCGSVVRFDDVIRVGRVREVLKLEVEFRGRILVLLMLA